MSKVNKTFSIISIAALVIAIISGILHVMYDIKFLDTVAVYGMIVFITPFVLLQYAMSANLEGYQTKEMDGFAWVFYLLIFPAVNFILFAGINALFEIVPNWRLAEPILRDATREESATLAWTYMGIMYISLNGLGLLVRTFRKTPTMTVA